MKLRLRPQAKNEPDWVQELTEGAAIAHCDNLEFMRLIPSGSVDLIVTSPPYPGLRGARKQSVDQWLDYNLPRFQQMVRILKPAGVLVLNVQFPRTAAGETDLRLYKLPVKINAYAKLSDALTGGYNTLDNDDALRVEECYIWCLSGGARVYVKSQTGVAPMSLKDMARLDPSTIKLWNGEKWTRVLGLNKVTKNEGALKITLRSGERICSTAEHKWPTQRGLIRTDKLLVGDVIETTTLPDEQAPHNQLPDQMIGWLVGLYLAEGSKGKQGKVLQFASHINEVVSGIDNRFTKLQRITEAYDGSIAWHKTSENGVTINIYGQAITGIIEQYIVGNTAKRKHLSSKCWRRNNVFLRALLDGYLSGDGHWDKKNKRWRLGFTRNYYLENDLRTLCARLGVNLRLKLASVGEFKTFKGEIRFSKSDHFSVKHDSEVVKIGRSGTRIFFDIGVEDEPHLYALASGVLTHNSKVNPVPAGDMKKHDIPGWEPVFVLTRSADFFFSPQRKPYAENTIVRFKHGDGRGDGIGQVYNSGGPSNPHPDGARLTNVLRISSSGGVKRPRATGGSFPTTFVDRFIAQYAAPDAVIFDPWAGVGTAVLQALLAGHCAFGCDTDIHAVADGNEWIRSTLAKGVQTELF